MNGPAAVTPAAPAVLPLPRRVRFGDRIRWSGRLWDVLAVLPHPLFGDVLRLSGVEDGAYELINARGADGNFEILPEPWEL